MGFTRWNPTDWQTTKTANSTKTTSQIFTSQKLQMDLNPLNVVMRESRDSDLNPNSNPIIVAVDVTGSMGIISEYLVKTGLGILFDEILTRKPIADPHLMVMAIGDAHTDRAPLQVSQFEADNTIVKWLEKIYLEGNGGGNRSESYHFPLYFAAKHTSVDSIEKRNKKGYLFTIGDEGVPPALTKDQIKRFIGDDSESLTYEQLLAMASKMYNVYHIIIGQGSYASNSASEVKSSWQNVLGERAVWLDDYKCLSEVIVSIIQLNEGSDIDQVVSSWNGNTSLVVKSAVKDLQSRSNDQLSVNSTSNLVVF